uniref:(S)-2-hydroxy-acid oxidase n=1 Tax=Varanus komodoensis TaxID=61221 RepID=A0A8D2IVR4_VARKO
MSLVCLSDFEAYAKHHLPKPVWDYFAAGADEALLLQPSISSHRILFRPRMLQDMSAVETKTAILGAEISFPVGIAPTGFHKLAWPDGEQSTARAAQAMSTCYIASTYSNCSVEEIVAAAPSGLRWFQLYIHRKRSFSEQLVRRVESLGFQALVLTADLPYTGKRRDDIRNNFQFLSSVKLKNFDGFFEVGNFLSIAIAAILFYPSVTWKDISWLQSLTRLPLIIKGILTKEDAELAVRHGVQGIIVSNHGGRQLDGVPASIDALVEVVAAVQGKAEVYLDGGIRTGSDVLKALALGAKCVFIGRPAIWGLQGEEGLQQVLKILKDEFCLSMALAGKHHFPILYGIVTLLYFLCRAWPPNLKSPNVMTC